VDVTWGGLGEFEYSGKVLPHALMHTKEMVMRGGHHGAYCTSLVETGHKRYIKMASRYSRKYASRNTTQEHMLTWVLRQKVWTSACNLKLNLRHSTSTDDADASDNVLKGKHGLYQPIQLQQDWLPDMTPLSARALGAWGNTFLAKDVLVSRAELLTLLRMKLELRNTNAINNRILDQLHIRFYGVFAMQTAHGFRRRFVGLSSVSKSRRDFVRVRGTENNTALSAQVRKVL